MEGWIFLKYTFAECKRSFVVVPMFGHFRVILMFTMTVFYHLLFTNVKYFVKWTLKFYSILKILFYLKWFWSSAMKFWVWHYFNTGCPTFYDIYSILGERQMSEISTFRWFFAYLTSFCASIFVRIEFSEFQHGHSLGMTKSSIIRRSP